MLLESFDPLDFGISVTSSFPGGGVSNAAGSGAICQTFLSWIVFLLFSGVNINFSWGGVLATRLMPPFHKEYLDDELLP